MYRNPSNLFNNNNAMALEVQVHQAFLNTPEGRAAEQQFADAKRLWWESMNNPQQENKIIDNSEYEAKLNALEGKLNTIIDALQQNHKED